MKTSSQYQDFALILAWPDATIRGDEVWMMFLKKLGLVKNLNFKVGHTGIVLIERASGKLRFYDFGRYISPRGQGRARSKDSDPKLAIGIRAQINGDCILNLLEIVQYFETMKDAMQGSGELYLAIVAEIDFCMAKAFADSWVRWGSYPYGAVARNNNNCSRFITRLLMHASKKFHFWHSINFPETIKASPMSNLVNAAPDRTIYRYSDSAGLCCLRMNRFSSLAFLLRKLKTNICRSLASTLPEDITIGGMVQKDRPAAIPCRSQYLGGIGEGAWFYIEPVDTNQAIVQRYTIHGDLEYTVLARPTQPMDFNSPYHVCYDSHFLFTHLEQNSITIRLEHVRVLSLGEISSTSMDKYA